MFQAVQSVERAIKERRETDVSLMNWWLYVLLVGPVTFGIYGLVIFYRRISRVDSFIERKQRYYAGVCTFTERYAEEMGRLDSVRNDINDLTEAVAHKFARDIKPINALLSVVLTVLTFGLWGLYVMYRLNSVWYDLQVVEQDFDDKVSVLWKRLELSKYPISFSVDTTKRRSFPLYLILSIVTFGIWGLVWDYKIHTDPDSLYREFHAVEDTVLQTVRK